jgi:hypothetical protein
VTRSTVPFRLSTFVTILLVACAAPTEPITPSAPAAFRAQAAESIRFVVIGDSRATVDPAHGGDPWGALPLRTPYAWLNLSRGGEVLRSFAASRNGEVMATYTAGYRCLVIEAAGNDLVISPLSPREIYAFVDSLTRQAHGRHVRVIVGTILPATATAGITSAFEARRREYNALVHRNEAHADAIAALDESPILGPVTAASDTLLYYDGHHLTLKANHLAAPIWAAALERAYRAR